LLLVGIPLLIVGVIGWVVLASLAAARASQGQAYRYPLTLRLGPLTEQAQRARPPTAGQHAGLAHVWEEPASRRIPREAWPDHLPRCRPDPSVRAGGLLAQLQLGSGPHTRPAG
jgi:hypothetical protein